MSSPKVPLPDTVRSEAGPLVEYMEQMGVEVWMATGDNHRTAATVAKQLGISHVLSEAKPSGKKEGGLSSTIATFQVDGGDAQERLIFVRRRTRLKRGG